MTKKDQRSQTIKLDARASIQLRKLRRIMISATHDPQVLTIWKDSTDSQIAATAFRIAGDWWFKRRLRRSSV